MHKILVTGGAGYIGSHNVLALLDAGYDVIIFDNLEIGHPETVEALKKVSSKGSVIDFIKGDLKNFSDINAVFQKHDILAVIHFAAYSQVSESVKDPQKYYYNNVYGTMNLLKAMIENNVKKIVFSSTASIYGEPEYIDDYLRIIKQELKTKFDLSEEEAAKAVYKSAVRSILLGSNEELRRFQMHKSLDETVLDIYRQYKNVGSRVSARNGEDEAEKILQVEEHPDFIPIRSKHKENVSVLQDIPLKFASDDDGDK